MNNTQKLNTVLLLLVAFLGVMALIFSLVALSGVQAIRSELFKTSSGVPAPGEIFDPAIAGEASQEEVIPASDTEEPSELPSESPVMDIGEPPVELPPEGPVPE